MGSGVGSGSGVEAAGGGVTDAAGCTAVLRLDRLGVAARDGLVLTGARFGGGCGQRRGGGGDGRRGLGSGLLSAAAGGQQAKREGPGQHQGGKTELFHNCGILS